MNPYPDKIGEVFLNNRAKRPTMTYRIFSALLPTQKKTLKKNKRYLTQQLTSVVSLRISTAENSLKSFVEIEESPSAPFLNYPPTKVAKRSLGTTQAQALLMLKLDMERTVGESIFLFAFEETVGYS